VKWRPLETILLRQHAQPFTCTRVDHMHTYGGCVLSRTFAKRERISIGRVHSHVWRKNSMGWDLLTAVIVVFPP